MQERNDSLEPARSCVTKGRGRHQVIDAPLVDVRERAGCDEHGERREGDREQDCGAASDHDAARPAAS